MAKYEDDTIIGFGKHKGKELENVPAEWLLWYESAEGKKDNLLIEYIEENKDVLIDELKEK